MATGKRHVRRLAAIAAIGLVLVALVAGRTALFRAAGWTLVAEDPIQPADVIVVAIDAGEAGVLEAADLVAAGVSRSVALFAAAPDALDREFARRGVPREDETQHLASLLAALGVRGVEPIPMAVAGTEDEGVVLPRWCAQHGFATVLIVSNADHSRRIRRVLHRAMNGGDTRVIVRRSRYSLFDPDCWWRSRDGVRRGIVELEKLLFDVVRHPIS